MIVDRKCDGCTKCCEGWLTGEAHGRRFWPGSKCHFCTSSGCEIYEDRPEDPCKAFKCAWLSDPDLIPAWAKPSEINAVMVWREAGGVKYLDVSECGERLDVALLSWMIIAHANGLIPAMRWQIDGGKNYLGPPAFLATME